MEETCEGLGTSQTSVSPSPGPKDSISSVHSLTERRNGEFAERDCQYTDTISLDFLNSFLDVDKSLPISGSQDTGQSRTNKYSDVSALKSVCKSYNVRFSTISRLYFVFSMWMKTVLNFLYAT
ncbi:hypothetical protein D915_003595 [Fasciola hepatica]|uniref:Uncharacterized protein n=1 Tax=Fasciola hepatica TaxID=6192 RepID=A0A4E0S0J9_FASHE|nr:hypothetical protein D915_003595 [Fasciola hepatica]